MTTLISPHGAEALKPLFVANDAEREQLTAEAQTLPSIVVSSAAAGNAVMLAAGYFTPLDGYMTKADAISVGTSLSTADGLFWPTPVLNLLKNAEDFNIGDRIALRDPNVEGSPVLAVQTIEAIDVFTDDEISTLTQVLNYSYFETDFPDTFRTASDIRDSITANGWKRVVAFQTRNPMHRAHEELCHMAMQRLDADGLVIHMLLGKLKPGDIPAPVRDAAIRTMIDLYFPENSAMVTGYGFDMLYAGPREALLHALFRQNMGATHFIIGRDHAADHTAYSKKLDKVVMMSEAPNHTKEDFVLLSGTAVRKMLGEGIAPPVEFSRPEVAKILMDHYQQS